MAKADVIVKVLDIPEVREHIERLEWQVECLTAMLRSPWCSQCGNTWAGGGACGPTHAAIAANHPSLSGSEKSAYEADVASWDEAKDATPSGSNVEGSDV